MYLSYVSFFLHLFHSKLPVFELQPPTDTVAESVLIQVGHEGIYCEFRLQLAMLHSICPSAWL
jgi:hypothetical protein